MRLDNSFLYNDLSDVKNTSTTVVLLNFEGDKVLVHNVFIQECFCFTNVNSFNFDIQLNLFNLKMYEIFEIAEETY